MTKNISPTLGFAHTATTSFDAARSVQRARDYIGQYACVHSAPSAWYGIVVDASIDAGVVSVDLADAGLWTQGMTKDLVRPARKVSADLESRRDGLVTVTAVTAIQPAGAFSEGDDKVGDAIKPRMTRCVPPSEQGTSLEDFAAFMDQTPGQTAAAVLEIYHKTRDAKAKAKDTDDLRGNFAALVNFCAPYAAKKDFPVRGTVSIILAGARKYVW